MSNMSKYQNNYWFPKVADFYHGEYCRGCGISSESNWKGREFTGLRIDKINNDGNHTIKDNDVTDFQLLCVSCNRVKNPVKKPSEREMTSSEETNRRAEKPLMEWLMQRLRDNQKTSWKFFVSEGSYLYDISPETIERRYYKKYFVAPSAPFGLDMDERQETIIVLKKREDKPKSNLDIDPHTPTPFLRD